MSIWEEVLQKYPSIQDVLDDVYKSQLALFEKNGIARRIISSRWI